MHFSRPSAPTARFASRPWCRCAAKTASRSARVISSLAAAAMASWCTFAPSFLWIFAGAPYAEKLRTNARAAGALAAITAAVLGVVTQLGVWFGIQVLFSAHQPWMAPWGATLSTPDLATFRLAPALLAVASAVALIRLKWNPLLVVAAAVLLGLFLPVLVG